MIVCTGCGTKNQDSAIACQGCGRKLQSRWAAPAPAPDAQNGQSRRPGGLGAAAEPVWQLLQPVVRGFDEGAAKLMHSALETWAYGLTLVGCAVAAALTGDWWWLAGGVGGVALLAWLRGI